jgi:hypothetical chaperone protein
VYAVDFGTSNSLLAAANADEVFAPAPLEPGSDDAIILRSVLYFPSADQVFYGHEAITRYAENGLEGRLLRSIKKHLPSRSFHGTYIDDRPMTLEDLVAAILREMRLRANAHYGVDVRRGVFGRPARFSEDDGDDRLAENRLRLAAERAGYEEIAFVPEPVAAAREFGAGLGEPRAVLVGDFGGGTSDFTVMRFGARAFTGDDVLAIGGVPLAGDAFDASIMRSKVARHFGSEVIYKVPFGANVLRMPLSIVEQLCSPANLSILRRQDVAEFLRNVRSWSVGPDDKEKLDQLRVLVDDAQGFSLFEVIERCKRALSTGASADVDFSYADAIDVHEPVTRAEFDAGAERETRAILRCLDDTVARSGLAPAEIDLVCCTGGTAKVPVIAAALRERFGDARVSDFKSFTSVVEGLAIYARGLARDGVVPRFEVS